MLSEDQRSAKVNALTDERDALLLSNRQTRDELTAQRTSCEAQSFELDKLKAAHKAQSDVLTALAAAYLRETGKAFTLKGLSEYFASSEQQNDAVVAPSASSVAGFDVVDDAESVA